MVEFSEYVSLAYQIADEKGFGNQLRGPGTQQANRRLMSELSEAYNKRDGAEETRAEAREFLEENLRAP